MCEDIKTGLHTANNLVKVHWWLWWTGTQNASGTDCFCLSLFIHPCASSPDQLRHEKPVCHFPIEHLSLLFIGLTKGMLIFPGFMLTWFSPPSKHTHTYAAMHTHVPGNLKPIGCVYEVSSLIVERAPQCQSVSLPLNNMKQCTWPDSPLGTLQFDGNQERVYLV